MKTAYARLEYLVGILPDLLNKIPDHDFTLKLSQEKWSKKEILGHLIDSATNNHHRFIRSQYEDAPTITYQQNEWNRLNRYNELDRKHVINFWTLYNQHILAIIKNMKPEELQRKCNTESPGLTVEFLFTDYVKHLEHHMRQILNYK